MKINKLKNALVLLMLVGATGLLTGCFEDEDNTYQGPLQVEFKPVTRTVNNGAGLQELRVQLIGPQQSQPITVSVSADESSTAQAGVHYNLVDNGQVTIPANSSFGAARVDVLGAPTGGKLVLTLSGDDQMGVIAAENYKQFTLTIRAPQL